MTTRPREEPDVLVGGYRLLAKIGEGGMGVVHLARRDDVDAQQVADGALARDRVGLLCREDGGAFGADAQHLVGEVEIVPEGGARGARLIRLPL
ncbi:MAG: hypothetical protein KJ938_12900, partial [Actinobacteria bacterium]|nr:hypothetical protein [Actinomycetota bacterium]